MKTINKKSCAKSELNNVLKEEYKSFSSLCKILAAKKESTAMKYFLNQYSLTFEQIIDIEYLKKGLTFATFTASNGSTYETIARKNKAGETVPAKWSFWLILTAAAKVRKEEIKAAQKAAMLAKEKSLQLIEKEEKKTTKKATTKKVAEKEAVKEAA